MVLVCVVAAVVELVRVVEDEAASEITETLLEPLLATNTSSLAES